VTAAVGMACGGDLPLVALTTTIVYFIVTYLYPLLVKRMPRSRYAPSELRLVYLDGHGILRDALEQCAQRGFSISDVSIKNDGNGRVNGARRREVTVNLELRGQGSLPELAAELGEMDGIVDVSAGDSSEISTY
jgi:putative Mg2+ transporter-C (MgtC) family protein